jgi:hypothetical protein
MTSKIFEMTTKMRHFSPSLTHDTRRPPQGNKLDPTLLNNPSTAVVSINFHKKTQVHDTKNPSMPVKKMPNLAQMTSKIFEMTTKMSAKNTPLTHDTRRPPHRHEFDATLPNNPLTAVVTIHHLRHFLRIRRIRRLRIRKLRAPDSHRRVLDHPKQQSARIGGREVRPGAAQGLGMGGREWDEENREEQAVVMVVEWRHGGG